MRARALLLPLLLLPLLGAQAPPPALPAAAQVDDGPHVLWEAGKGRVLRWRQGKPEEAPLPPTGLLELEGLPPLRLSPVPPPPARAVFPAVASLAAISDIHGRRDAMAALLKAQGIIDAKGAWAFGKGHLVVAGDLVDYGSQVTETVWMVRSLAAQAEAQGGAVHVLLGNHEVMDMRGDLRYLHPKYRALPLTTPFLMGPGTELGRWLRSLPAMIRIGDVLFTHGGPSAAFAQEHPGVDHVNALLRAELDGPRGAVTGGGGPQWYRGLVPGFSRKDATPAEVDQVLAGYGAARVVVGHTTLERVTAFFGGRVHVIDADFKEGKPGEVWLQIDGKRWRGTADGRRFPLD
ncbi:MAG TPA: metallophosphoesterase [Holophaga sp.]|nr:metallophosphoesterase [Holophaga sp.]